MLDRHRHRLGHRAHLEFHVHVVADVGKHFDVSDLIGFETRGLRSYVVEAGDQTGHGVVAGRIGGDFRGRGLPERILICWNEKSRWPKC